MSNEMHSLAIIACFVGILVIFCTIAIRCSYTCYKKSIRKSEGLLLDQQVNLTPRSSGPHIQVGMMGTEGQSVFPVKVVPNFYTRVPKNVEAEEESLSLIRSHSPTHTLAYVHSQLPLDNNFHQLRTS